MGGLSSMNKGKRAEREVVQLLQPVVDKVYREFYGLRDARTGVAIEPVKLQRNTLQSDGGGFDIIGLEWLALEVKFHETPQVETWWKQTVRQAKEGQEPCLVWRKSRVDWKVMMMGVLPAGDKRVRCRIESRKKDWLLWVECRLRWELKKRISV